MVLKCGNHPLCSFWNNQKFKTRLLPFLIVFKGSWVWTVSHFKFEDIAVHYLGIGNKGFLYHLSIQSKRLNVFIGLGQVVGNYFKGFWCSILE